MNFTLPKSIEILERTPDVLITMLQNIDLTYSDPDYHIVVKITILFILYVLCLEVDLDNSPYQAFWKET